MSISDLWLIPVKPSPGLATEARKALIQLHLDHRLVRATDVRNRLSRELPGAAIIQADRLQPALLEVQRWLSEHYVPTLVLLESLDDRSEAMLLGRGAQDVVLVPATPTRLRARMWALYRSRRSAAQAGEPADTLISVPPDLVIYPERRAVMVGERHVNLTRSEFDLLVVLARVPTDVVSRQRLAAALNQGDLGARALESHVSRLRIKLRASGAPPRIQAVRGVGYRLTRLNPPPLPPSTTRSNPPL